MTPTRFPGQPLLPRQDAQRRFNIHRVRDALVRFPGITGKELAVYLHLTPNTVSRHIRALRAEWNPKDPSDA